MQIISKRIVLAMCGNGKNHVSMVPLLLSCKLNARWRLAKSCRFVDPRYGRLPYSWRWWWRTTSLPVICHPENLARQPRRLHREKTPNALRRGRNANSPNRDTNRGLFLQVLCVSWYFLWSSHDDPMFNFEYSILKIDKITHFRHAKERQELQLSLISKSHYPQAFSMTPSG